MIVQLTSGEYPADEFAIGLARPLTVGELAARARARPGTYAYGLVEALHWSMFDRGLDMKRDYEAYFAVEYGTFGEYLRRRYRYSPKLVGLLKGLYATYALVLHVEPHIGLLRGEDGLLLLKSLLSEESEV